MLAIDHVILPVRDLGLEAAELEARYGLASVEGGRHPAWGTANRIVPLGDSYLELVAVVDQRDRGPDRLRAMDRRRDARACARLGRSNDSIDAVGRRLGQPVLPGSRTTPSGAVVSWRSVGADIAIREPGLPFFIQWGDGMPLPGAAAVKHRGGPITLKTLSVAADPVRLAGWLGDHDLPIAVTGLSGTSAMTLTGGRGDFSIG